MCSKSLRVFLFFIYFLRILRIKGIQLGPMPVLRVPWQIHMCLTNAVGRSPTAESFTCFTYWLKIVEPFFLLGVAAGITAIPHHLLQSLSLSSRNLNLSSFIFYLHVLAPDDFILLVKMILLQITKIGNGSRLKRKNNR